MLSDPQEECFNEKCGFDGGEGFCLPPGNVTDPWSDCPEASLCRKVSENGDCNPECNSRDCLFDSYECIPTREDCPADTAWVKAICSIVRSVDHWLWSWWCYLTMIKTQTIRFQISICLFPLIASCPTHPSLPLHALISLSLYSHRDSSLYVNPSHTDIYLLHCHSASVMPCNITLKCVTPKLGIGTCTCMGP